MARALTFRRVAGAFLGLFSLVLIGLGTLIPAPQLSPAAAETPLWCLVCGDIGLTDVLQNIFFFVPLGLALGLLGLDWRRAALTGGPLALVVELSQLFLVAGRDASLSDLITNTVGTGLGAGVVHWMSAPAFASPKAARTLLIGSLLSLAGLWVLGAWLLGPEPAPGPWVASTKPVLKDHVTFRGPLDGVLAGNVAVLDRTVLSDAAARAYTHASLPVSVELPAPGPRLHGAILVVEGEGQARQILVAMTRAGSAKLTLRIRASRFRLQPLRFYAARAFKAPEGTPVFLTFARTGPDLSIVGQVGGAHYDSRQQLGPHWLLALVSPLPAWAGPEWTAIAFSWVGLLLGVVAFAARRLVAPARGPLLSALIALLPVLSALGWMSLVNILAGYPPVPLAGGAICAVCAATGVWFGVKREA